MLEIRCHSISELPAPPGRQAGGFAFVGSVFSGAVLVSLSPGSPQWIVGRIPFDTMDGVTRRKRPLAGTPPANRIASSTIFLRIDYKLMN